MTDAPIPILYREVSDELSEPIYGVREELHTITIELDDRQLEEIRRHVLENLLRMMRANYGGVRGQFRQALGVE